MKLIGSLVRLRHLWMAFKTPLTSLEKFKILETGKEYFARVDSGALVCAIHADEIKVDEVTNFVSFKHEGEYYTTPLLRMKLVKSSLGIMNRPRISWTIEWNGKRYENIEVSLADRSKLRYNLLIGRNLIKQIKLPVYISDQEVED